MENCYGNAYTAKVKPLLASTDHNAGQHISIYCTSLKSSKPENKVVRLWSPENVEILKGCFLCTDLEALYDPNIDKHNEIRSVYSMSSSVWILWYHLNKLNVFQTTSLISSRTLKSVLNWNTWLLIKKTLHSENWLRKSTITKEEKLKHYRDVVDSDLWSKVKCITNITPKSISMHTV